MNGMKTLEKKKENLELRVESWTRLNLQGRVLLQPCETENSGPDRPSGSETQSCCLRGSKQKNKKNKIKAGTCLGVRFCTHTHAHAPLKSVSMTSEPFFLVARREICSANCSRRSRRVCWLSAWQNALSIMITVRRIIHLNAHHTDLISKGGIEKNRPYVIY